MIYKMAALIAIFHLKHFIADYPLQNEYMLGKFKEKDWQFPLLAHCYVHYIFTLVIAAFFADMLVASGLAAFDFYVHFAMDRIKASPKMLGRFQALTKTDFEEHQKSLIALSNFSDQTYETIQRTFDKFEKRKKENKYFWWSLGLDQMVHHLTDLVVVVGILTL
jgi:hypothetical protein